MIGKVNDDFFKRSILPSIGASARQVIVGPQMGVDAAVLKVGEGPDRGELYPLPFKAIPYFAWAHRGPGQMAVWISSN